jgi:tocopherol cyclase
MRRFARSTLNPACYHGHGKKPPFFEGWYYKLVDASEEHRYAVIPGIFLSEDPDRHHAFVQVLNGLTGESVYQRYPPEEFWAADGELNLHIGPNRFTAERLKLDLRSTGFGFSGELRFSGLTPWPVTLTSPGIMGWYAWVPAMECYHGVISLDHTVQGGLRIDGRIVDFSEGRGYIEKDWGQSFPAAWIWFQTNHFEQPGTSLTASVAIIPWVRRSFPGFIIGLWHGGILYRFASYTGARIEQLEFTDADVIWVVRDRRYRLAMRAARTEGGLLQAPTVVDMGRRIAETLGATVDVELHALESAGPRLIFRGTGRHAGLEAVGDLVRLRSMWASERQYLKGVRE